MAFSPGFNSAKFQPQQKRARRLFSIYVFLLIGFYGQLFVASIELDLYQQVFYGWGVLLAVGVVSVRYLFVWAVVHSSPVSNRRIWSVIWPFIPALLNFLFPLVRAYLMHESVAPISTNHYWGHAMLYMTLVPAWASVVLLFAPLTYVFLLQQRLIFQFIRFGKSDVFYYTKRIYLIGIHFFAFLSLSLALIMVIQVGAHYQFWQGVLPLSIHEGFLPLGIKLVPLMHLAMVILLFSIPKLVKFEPINPEENRARLRAFFNAYSRAVRGEEEPALQEEEHPLVVQIREQRLFLIGELRMDELARELKIPSADLRRLFVDEMGLNFNQLINGLRVEYLLTLIEEGGLDTFTLEALGRKAGFNSRATMYRAIKRFAPEYVYQI